MDRLISYLIALCVAAGAMGSWDRHPPIGWHSQVLFWRVGFDLPDSLATQRDKALAASKAVAGELSACRASTSTLEISIGQQNAEIAAQGAESERRLKMLSEGLDQARKGRAGAEARAAGLLEHPAAGVDACARSEAAARAVVDALK